MSEPCIQFGTAALALYGALAGCTALLIVAYLISVARKVRLAERTLQVLGHVRDPKAEKQTPASMELAYEELHRIERENLKTDNDIRRGMWLLAAEEYRLRRANYNDTEGEGA